jgi:peptidyl-prolyl cis-trans isomerase C
MTRKADTILLLAAAFCALLLAPAGAQTTPPAPSTTVSPSNAASGGKVVARVEGSPITESDLAIAADDPALSLPGMTDQQKRDLLIGYMIDLKLGAKAAEAAKIGDTPDFARRLAYLRDKVLMDEYLDREVKKAVTPEAARKLYDETVKTMKPEDEVRARHILVESEDEAKKVEARLKAGEDFAKIAAEVSKDPGSKAEGGELGFFTKDRMVAPFAEAAFKMQKGQISDPVKSQFGWHVIQVEEKRQKPVPSYDEMKEQVEAYLTRKTQQDIVLVLREKGKVERLEAPAPAAAPASPSSGGAAAPAQKK